MILHRGIALYALLTGLFVAFLVVCNLIANKFIVLEIPFRASPLVISCGVLPYPLTFIITDLLSEFYGKKRTSHVVMIGLVASFFIVILLKLTTSIPAWEFSPASTQNFEAIFGNSWRVISASMAAYLVAQLVDVKLYDFWKKFTKGRHLWLRNNGSTAFSQLVDTLLVVSVLFLGTEQSHNIGKMVMDGWMFKAMCAIVDTPIIYGLVFLMRQFLRLKPNEEFSFSLPVKDV